MVGCRPPAQRGPTPAHRSHQPFNLAQSHIHPFLLPFALSPCSSLAFFLMLSITEKYNLLYVRREAWQAGGALWPRMAGQLTASLLIAQVVLFLLLAIKRAPWVAATLLPLLAITALFRVAARELVERPFSVLSLRAAVDLDANDGIDDLPGAAGGGEAAAAAYRQPDLQFDEAREVGWVGRYRATQGMPLHALPPTEPTPYPDLT